MSSKRKHPNLGSKLKLPRKSEISAAKRARSLAAKETLGKYYGMLDLKEKTRLGIRLASHVGLRPNHSIEGLYVIGPIALARVCLEVIDMTVDVLRSGCLIRPHSYEYRDVVLGKLNLIDKKHVKRTKAGMIEELVRSCERCRTIGMWNCPKHKKYMPKG